MHQTTTLTGIGGPLTAPRTASGWLWVRDFALVGLVTGFVAPFTVLRNPEYAQLASAGGALTGAALGALSHLFFARAGRRWPKFAIILLSVLVGAVWGSASGVTTALAVSFRRSFELSLVVGGCAGALQLSWFWVVYAMRSVRRKSTWSVVLAASLFSVALGWGSVALLVVAGHR